MGQYEVSSYQKRHNVTFIDDQGNVTNIDLLASAIKEATTSLSQNGKDKELYVVLPQTAFYILRTEVPMDVVPGAVDSFVKEKIRSSLSEEIDSYISDYLSIQKENQREITIAVLEKSKWKGYQDAISLLGLRATSVIPDTIAYFTMFEKTLRKEKKEQILYVNFEDSELVAYRFDSYGPLETPRFYSLVNDNKSLEDVLKKQVGEFEKEVKLNRLILSGKDSDTIRQDTFTKNTGVWTNPLKRIIPQFYQEYLKILLVPGAKPLPILEYDVCVGAFIFSLEHKQFSVLKKNSTSSASLLSLPKANLPKKEVFIFLSSFLLSFLLFIVLSSLNVQKFITLPMKATPTPTTVPSPIPATPTPSPSIARKDLKIKVLNGSGIAGKATVVKNILKEKGYEEILTDNADNYDFTTTVIQVKKNQTGISEMVKTDLKDNVVSPKIAELDDKETADVVITFGTDFK